MTKNKVGWSFQDPPYGLQGCDGQISLIITDHGEKRFKERTGLPKRLVTKKAREALRYGIKRNDTSGSLRRYFEYLYRKEMNADNVRIYLNYVYIFHQEYLITVFQLPQAYRKTAEKIQRQKKEKEGNTRVGRADLL